MLKPDYSGGSIVNLISSISSAYGGSTNYKCLRYLNPSDLRSFKNIVLVVVDGLGFNYLVKQQSFLSDKIKAKITSVFPATTAAAIPTFLTGLAPQQHSMVGWFMYLKELGLMVMPLRFQTVLGQTLSGYVEVADLFPTKHFANSLRVNRHYVTPQVIKETDYNKSMFNKFNIHGFKNINGFFRQIKRSISSPGKKFIYAYWMDFDLLAHHHGIRSSIVKNHFKLLDKGFQRLFASIGKETQVIITADHGFIDVPKKKLITLEKFPKIFDFISVPIWGDSRVLYISLKLGSEKSFLRFFKRELSFCCSVYKSRDLVSKGYFGLGKVNKRFLERIGDYVIILKENYAFEYHELKNVHIGRHSGVSEDEMFVPLITLA